MSTNESGSGSRPRNVHGQVCYLQIPAVDIDKSASFYAAVFGWSVEAGQSGFEAPGLIGQWTSDLKPASADDGPLLWISVDRIDDALEAVSANGGEVIVPTLPDGSRWLATIRDPAGNAIGLAQHGPR